MVEDNWELPDDLPVMSASEKFRFSCGPDSPCFNRCCAQLNLPLTPYDVLRLRHNLALSGKEFLHLFSRKHTDGETGFPVFFLRMIESVDAPCSFVTPAGCSVYGDRPGACRSYPLGRGAKMGREGICERFFMVREEHCRGFDAGPEYTPSQWFVAEGMEKYIHYNDKYMRLLSMAKASGKPLDGRFSGMAVLALWQMDDFRQFLEKVNLLAQVEGPACENPELMADSVAGDEALLDLGMAWLELLMFGVAPNLRKKT